MSQQLAPAIAAITKDLQTPTFVSLMSQQLAPTSATVTEYLGAVADGLFGDAAAGVDLESLASEVEAAVTQAARDAGEDPVDPGAEAVPYRSAADRALIQVFTFLITSSLLLLAAYRVPGPDWTAAVQELWRALGLGAVPVGLKAAKAAGGLYDRRVGPASSNSDPGETA